MQAPEDAELFENDENENISGAMELSGSSHVRITESYLQLLDE